MSMASLPAVHGGHLPHEMCLRVSEASGDPSVRIAGGILGAAPGASGDVTGSGPVPPRARGRANPAARGRRGGRFPTAPVQRTEAPWISLALTAAARDDRCLRRPGKWDPGREALPAVEAPTSSSPAPRTPCSTSRGGRSMTDPRLSGQESHDPAGETRRSPRAHRGAREGPKDHGRPERPPGPSGRLRSLRRRPGIA